VIPGRSRQLGRLAAFLVLGLGLSGCFESKEEAALSAYEDRDFGRAAELAAELAAEDNPRGYELQALLSAQGIGRPLDFTDAMALIDKAVALDPALEPARRTILDRVAIAETQGEKAFAAEDYDRALRLAEPLAAYGSAVGADLLDRLYAGHYVLLPESTLTWRSFWSRCSGSIRDEDEAEGEARFSDECLNKHVVWEGTLVRLRGKEASIKMSPGRSRAPVDVALALPEVPADDPIEAFGRRVRFGGTIAARGTVVRPDRLSEAAIIGPAYQTQADRDADQVAQIKDVRAACINLLTNLYKTSHAPEWVEAARQRAKENNWPAQPMAFSIRLTTPDTAFEKQNDGSWVGHVEGVAEIILARVKPGHFTSIAFAGQCRVERLDTKKPEEIGTADIASEEVQIDFEG